MAFSIVGTAAYVPTIKKEKISTDPNNKFWENDKNKFGMKMMMKMGWSEGKGLGKNEDGRADYIKTQANTTKSGLGADLDTSKNWLANSSDFNNVLAALNAKYSSNKQDASETQQQQPSKPKHLISATKRQKAKCVNNYKKEDIAAILGHTTTTPPPCDTISFLGGENLHCLPTSLVARDYNWEDEPTSELAPTEDKQTVEEEEEPTQQKKTKRKKHDTNFDNQQPDEPVRKKKKKKEKQKQEHVEESVHTD